METANILICENERLVAKDIEVVLKKHGYSVVGTASDGLEALKLAETSRPDLALMDIRLTGGLNGITVAGMLAEQFCIPSIYLTAYADEETLEQAKETLPLSYLLKPFDERELISAVETGLYRFREQRRVVGALQRHIKNLCNSDAIEAAVQLEREFITNETINSNLKTTGNLATKLENDVELIGSLIRSALINETLGEENKVSLRGALIHQEKVSRILDRLARCSDTTPLKLDKHTIDPIVQKAIREAKSIVGQDMTFIEFYSPELLVGYLDQPLVEETLVELFLNAYQSVSSQGVITVTTSLVYEEFPERFNTKATPGWFIKLNVIDTGKGMDEKVLKHIFEPGFSSSISPSNDGLGLCFAHATMQRHRGWLRVESIPEQGTKVSLYFSSYSTTNGEIAKH